MGRVRLCRQDDHFPLGVRTNRFEFDIAGTGDLVNRSSLTCLVVWRLLTLFAKKPIMKGMKRIST